MNRPCLLLLLITLSLPLTGCGGGGGDSTTLDPRIFGAPSETATPVVAAQSAGQRLRVVSVVGDASGATVRLDALPVVHTSNVFNNTFEDVRDFVDAVGGEPLNWVIDDLFPETLSDDILGLTGEDDAPALGSFFPVAEGSSFVYAGSTSESENTGLVQTVDPDAYFSDFTATSQAVRASSLQTGGSLFTLRPDGVYLKEERLADGRRLVATGPGAGADDPGLMIFPNHLAVGATYTMEGVTLTLMDGNPATADPTVTLDRTIRLDADHITSMTTAGWRFDGGMRYTITDTIHGGPVSVATYQVEIVPAFGISRVVGHRDGVASGDLELVMANLHDDTTAPMSRMEPASGPMVSLDPMARGTTNEPYTLLFYTMDGSTPAHDALLRPLGSTRVAAMPGEIDLGAADGNMTLRYFAVDIAGNDEGGAHMGDFIVGNGMEGATLFADQGCGAAACHGPSGTGPSHIVGMDLASLGHALDTGPSRGTMMMPAYPDLTEEERVHIATFLLDPTHFGAPAMAPATGASAGRDLYFTHCATCHAAGAADRHATGGATDLAQASGITAVVRQGTATGMPAFGPIDLSDAQIADMEAYFATLTHGGVGSMP